MNKFFLVCISVLLMSQQSFGQKDTVDLKVQKPLLPKMIIPATLILSGVLLSGSKTEKNWQIDVRNKVGNDFRTENDNYIQYIPFAQIYIGDLVGMKAKNHWFDQTKNIFLGGMVTMVVTHSLKRAIGKSRPDGARHAFPSGHTAASFMGATMLYHEFKDENVIYASSGYLFSTTTGGMRVMNNRHWVSDVLAGAGVGILVANLIYHIEPLKNFNPFKNSKNISFSPMIDNEGFNFTASLQF